MKDDFKNWKKEIVEVSNGVYKVTWRHKLGATVEKTGHDVDIMEKEMRASVIEMNKTIEQKLNSPQTGSS